MTDPSDIPNLQEALHCFEAASGATVDIQKSRTIAIGNWNISLTVMNISYHDTTIFGFQIKRVPFGNPPPIVGRRRLRK
jgi:hypothetical protein